MKHHHPTSLMSPDDIARTLELENVKRLNDDALDAAMRNFSLVLPRHGQGWRATSRTRGTLSGLEHVGEMEILCTDGIVGFFVIVATQGVFYGHTAEFSGEVKPFASVTPKAGAKGDKTPRPRTPKAATVSLAMSLLSKLTSKRGSSL